MSRRQEAMMDDTLCKSERERDVTEKRKFIITYWQQQNESLS